MLQEVFVTKDVDALISAGARGHLKYSQVSTCQHKHHPCKVLVRAFVSDTTLNRTQHSGFFTLQRFRGGVLGGELLTLSRYPIITVRVPVPGVLACTACCASGLHLRVTGVDNRQVSKRSSKPACYRRILCPTVRQAMRPQSGMATSLRARASATCESTPLRVSW